MHHLSSAASRAAPVLALGTCTASLHPAQVQDTAPISQPASTAALPTGAALLQGVKPGRAAAVLSALAVGANVNVRDSVQIGGNYNYRRIC
jgi:hypothetical protein